MQRSTYTKLLAIPETALFQSKSPTADILPGHHKVQTSGMSSGSPCLMPTDLVDIHTVLYYIVTDFK